MSQEPPAASQSISPSALDEAGRVLGPERIPLAALIDPAEMIGFAQSVAEMTQMECSVVAHDPDRPRPVLPEAEFQIVRAPICLALGRVRAQDTSQCVRDVHAAAHAAMAAWEPVSAGCIGGDGTLYACPIGLCLSEGWHPKAAIVAAAQDIYHFHYADRLASLMGRPEVETEQLMCETDKCCLNAAQLRRMRAIINAQAVAFSRQISNRYEQIQAAATVVAQKEELGRAYAQVDRECRLVGQIQRGLVPQTAPRIEGFAVATHYRIARQAGGDYYDFFPRPDGSCGIIIADVSGHGAGAAVVLAMMRAILYTFPGESGAPQEMLQYANHHLSQSVLADQFATALFGLLEPGGAFRGVTAGHNPPLLFEKRTGKARMLTAEYGLPLAVIPEGDFGHNDAQLQAGDVLVLYTDGITEAFNPAGETFGTDRLAQMLRQHACEGAEAIRDAVIQEVERFAAGEAPHDDQTLIVLEKR